ncbi:hypothetical protein GLOIN_2v1768936 [Rhizophagus clarus]|uniref:Uncharacterized protein n=1 Tax=Rhizophagus clarus TaxID=94130 RepID=A0A8H3LJQ2_9GLOM|nr:hypothetical protein GLOIN_2v1768936 [Rhizophagus clarus]
MSIRSTCIFSKIIPMSHKYFERACSDWNIIGFLKECELEPFDQKLSFYISCLEKLTNSQEKHRRKKAQALLDQYRKVSFIIFYCRDASGKSIGPVGTRQFSRLFGVQGFQAMVNNGIGTIERIKTVNVLLGGLGDQQSDDDFVPFPIGPKKRKKNLSLKKNKELTSSKKVCTGPNSGTTPQTVTSEENEPVVGSIETAIIDVVFETLAKESLTSNDEWDRPHNDLAFYDIIDLTPGTNDLIATIVKAPDFRKAVNENFLSTRDGGNKEFAWDFAYQLANSFDHGNDLLHFNMSERMYREVFLIPIIRSLFRKESNVLDLFFVAEDADLKKNDAEERSSGRKIDVVWATKPPKTEFAICEFIEALRLADTVYEF